MGKYKGLFWPAILGVKHMPKVKESEFYNVAGGFRRATINDKIAFFLQHPVWEGRPELFMKTGSPKEIYAMSGMSVHGLCNLIGQPAQAQSHAENFIQRFDIAFSPILRSQNPETRGCCRQKHISWSRKG